MTITEKKIVGSRPAQVIEHEKLNHFLTKKADYGFDENAEMDNKQLEKSEANLLNGSAPTRSKPNLDLWLKEVVELRKKAGEYKVSCQLRFTIFSFINFAIRFHGIIESWLGY